MEDVIEKIAELYINGIDYILKLNANNEEIAVQLEQKNTGEIWNNLFSKDYVEDSTQKAGNFKKFNTFLKMLISAINKSSESVSLNILSYQDLEALKSRKNNNNKAQIQTNPILLKKKFLILQYQGEYDKVQYPLSLDLNENPDPITLKQIISRLRLENEVLRSGRSDTQDQNAIIQLKHENQILRAKLFRNEDNPTFDHHQNLKIIEESGEEIKYLKQILENRERELLILKSQNSKLMEDASNFEEMHDAISKIKEGERVMFQQQQRLEQMDLEMTSILQELETYKNNDKRQKQRILVLEQELEGTLNKVSTTNRSRNDSKNRLTNNLSSSINRGRSSSINNKKSSTAVINASPLRNSNLLNSSARQTPTTLSRNNSQSNLKRTPTRPTSSNQRQSSINLNRRNSIESDTASSNQRKTSNNMRASSPSRSSMNFNSSISKKSNNTPQKKTIISNTKIVKSPAGSTKNSLSQGNNLYTSKNVTKTNTLGNKTQQNKLNTNRVTTKNKVQNVIDDGSDDDSSLLMKKLEEFRKQNKENSDSTNALKRSRLLEKYGAGGSSSTNELYNKNDTNNLGSTLNKDKSSGYSNLQQSSYQENSTYSCDNTEDIANRINKIQHLLREAQN